MVIENSKFKIKDIHNYTRLEHGRGEESIIDYFIVSTELWGKVKEVKVKRGAEIGSDHYVVRMRRKGKETRKRKIVKEKTRAQQLKNLESRMEYRKVLDKIKTKNSNEEPRDVEERKTSVKTNDFLKNRPKPKNIPTIDFRKGNLSSIGFAIRTF